MMAKFNHHRFSPKGLQNDINVAEITSEEEMFMAQKTTSKKELEMVLSI